MRDKKYLMWLSSVPGVGSITFMNLIKYFGSAENVYQSSFSELITRGPSEKRLQSLF